MTPRGRLSVSLLKISSVYLVVGAALGLYMGISENHALVTVHSHLALVGWATMALTGLVYLVLPACERHPLGAVHFWLHNLGLPVMIGGLSVLILTSDARAEPVVGLGSAAVLLALVSFAANVLRNGREKGPGPSGE